MPSDTPFELVRRDMWRNSDRTPADEAAVQATAREGLHLLNEEVADFTEKLINTLDPDTQTPLGSGSACLLERMADVVEDPDAVRVQRWGALTLLGVISMVYDPDLVDLPTSEILDNHREQVAANVARGGLFRVATSSEVPEELKDTAGALLNHNRVPPEDVVLQLYDVLDTIRTDIAAPEDIDKAEQEKAIEYGSRVSEPYAQRLVADTDEMKDRFNNMDWLTFEGEDELSFEAQMRDVYHDGKQVAVVADLTEGHGVLRDLKEELENDPKLGDQFWPQLAMSITHYVETGRSYRGVATKVPTFIMRNKAKASENIMRAYYTPLGVRENGVRIIGLLGACRTKGNQPRVLRIITNSAGKHISEV